MPSDISLSIEVSGKDENGSIPPISIPIVALGLGGHQILKFRIPASGAPIVETIPGHFTQQTLFLLKSDLAVGVQLNAETALTPGSGGVLPAVVIRTGGPNVTSVTFTPNGTTVANVVVLVAGN